MTGSEKPATRSLQKLARAGVVVACHTDHRTRRQLMPFSTELHIHLTARIAAVLFALLLAATAAPRTMQLPAGTVLVHREMRIPAGTHVTGHPKGTVLRASARFRGRAVLVCERGVTVSGITVDGNRDRLARPVEMAPSDRDFIGFYDRNGMIADGADGLVVRDVVFRNVANFAIVAARSKNVTIERVRVQDSGSLNRKGRNNTTGGILLEEGTAHFTVRGCEFVRVRGNGIWTHSRYTSPRNGPGLIERNRFEELARDAIQVGHATEVRVTGNTGVRIGWPFDAVDAETGATPVAIDTAGNVDRSVYADNSFEELNGKCIDLDGFHHGDVVRNSCTNRGAATDYPHGHYGIVVNAWNPDMTSEEITIAGNVIDGAKFGGIFLIGRNHKVVGNRLLNLNLAGCNENAAKFGCIAIQGEPDVLQTGIYLGRIAAEWAQKRASPSSGLLIRDNVITGHRMKERCIAAAPGVRREDSTIANNVCRNTNE
jgi:hypothetical protein